LPHYHQHVGQSIDHVQHRAAGGVELVRIGLLFGSGGARRDARELDVIGLKLRRGAEFDLQLIEALAKASETVLNLGFTILICLQPCR